MPLEKGKANIGHNVKEEEAAGKPKAQAVAIALHTAGVPKARDNQPAMTSAPSSAMPSRRSANDAWPGRKL